MRKCMVADRMSFRDFALDQSGQGLRIAADEEKCRLHAFLGERVENLWGGLRGGPIVEGEHDFMIVERQASRIGFQPHLQAAGRPYLQGAGDAERFRPASRRPWSKEKNPCAGPRLHANRAERGSLHDLRDHETILWASESKRQALCPSGTYRRRRSPK